MGSRRFCMVSCASRIMRSTNSLHVVTSLTRTTLCPQFQMPRSGSLLAIPSRSRSNMTYSATSPNAILAPFSFSIFKIARASPLRITRDDPRIGRMTMPVALASASIIRCLNASGNLTHSLVVLKAVPICTPLAPRASAATSCSPVATPPLAKNGIFNERFARAIWTKTPMSTSPGSPPESFPIRAMTSDPSLSCATRACLT
mmetsp:Transcript_21531/g.38037  ORF Transcript_21531/g.38037 Transcript_21531/m.38037 type:complete len:202 (+) Transcript_21531:145-750(+)